MSSEDDVLSSFQIMFPGHVVDKMNTLGVDSDACFWAADHKSYTSTELRLQKFVDGAVEVSIKVMKLGGTTNMTKRNVAIKQSNFVRTSVYGKDKLQRECQPVGRFIFQKTLNSIQDPSRKGRGRPCNLTKNVNQKGNNMRRVSSDIGGAAGGTGAPRQVFLRSNAASMQLNQQQQHQSQQYQQHHQQQHVVLQQHQFQPQHAVMVPKGQTAGGHPRSQAITAAVNASQHHANVKSSTQTRNFNQSTMPNILQRQVSTISGVKQVNVSSMNHQQQHPAVAASSHSTPANAVMYIDSQGRLMTSAAVAALASQRNRSGRSSTPTTSRTHWQHDPQNPYPQSAITTNLPQTSQTSISSSVQVSVVQSSASKTPDSVGDIMRIAVAECIESKPRQLQAAQTSDTSKSLDEGLNPGDFLIKVIKEGLPGVDENIGRTRKGAKVPSALVYKLRQDVNTSIACSRLQTRVVARSLQSQLRMRIRRDELKCSKCSRVMLRPNNFKSNKVRLKCTPHVCKTPTRFTVHKCRRCTHQFNTYRESRHHLFSAHKWRLQAADAPFRCSVCHQGFYVESNLMDHTASAHPEVVPMSQCNE